MTREEEIKEAFNRIFKDNTNLDLPIFRNWFMMGAKWADKNPHVEEVKNSNNEEKMKIIGTHNTMSYLPPKHWWLKPFNWLFAKCQDDPIDYVYSHEIKCVDLRIYWDNKNKYWNFAHGSMAYKHIVNIDYLLDMLEDHGVEYIRIILERDGYEDSFIELCKRLEQRYPNITFLGGNRKSDWKQLYDFPLKKGNSIPLYQWVGSMAEDARWYEKFMPRVYAKRMNKKNLENIKEGINIFDFI